MDSLSVSTSTFAFNIKDYAHSDEDSQDTEESTSTKSSHISAQGLSKMTNPQEELSHLEREMDDISAEAIEGKSDAFVELMFRMDKWLRLYRDPIRVSLFTVHHTCFWSAGYDVFKAAILDFEPPVNAQELHTVCRVLDKLDERRITFKTMKRGAHTLLKNGLGISRKLRAGKFAAIAPGEPKRPLMLSMDTKFVDIMFLYGPITEIKTHPGHFSLVISLDMYVLNICRLIERRLDLATKVRHLYGMRFFEKISALPMENTLRELDFNGGPETYPTELILYYDIDDNNKSFGCPLFNASHYFLKNMSDAPKMTSTTPTFHEVYYN